MKPILTAATLILKATGTYKEGELSWSAGYLYVSFVYNISICLRYAFKSGCMHAHMSSTDLIRIVLVHLNSLYCLAMFWACVNTDIKPFRCVIFAFSRPYALAWARPYDPCQSVKFVSNLRSYLVSPYFWSVFCSPRSSRCRSNGPRSMDGGLDS